MLQAGAALLTAVSLPSCNGIFEGIYDEPVITADFGFTKVEQAGTSPYTATMSRPTAAGS